MLLPPLARALVDRYQRDLPLDPRPYATMGAALGVAEDDVLACLGAIEKSGVLSRVGPVFRPGALGCSTLAAIAAPPQRLAAIAEFISRQPEVNHNYEREHRLNLWFVVTARDEPHLHRTLDTIANEAGTEVHDLRLVDEYHIDLAFPLAPEAGAGSAHCAPDPATAPERMAVAASAFDATARGLAGSTTGGDAPRPRRGTTPATSRTDDRLIEAIQSGLPLVPRPFDAVGRQSGLGEDAVIGRLSDWRRAGIIKRFGLVLRHRPLGYAANAMAVWDVPDAEAGALGSAAARVPAVTLCYRRERSLPHWPYNLYCMVHGQDRDAVRARVAGLARTTGLDRYPSAILFSTRAFKQRGAHYRFPSEVGHG